MSLSRDVRRHVVPVVQLDLRHFAFGGIGLFGLSDPDPGDDAFLLITPLECGGFGFAFGVFPTAAHDLVEGGVGGTGGVDVAREGEYGGGWCCGGESPS